MWKFEENPSISFWVTLFRNKLTNRQTDRQTPTITQHPRRAEVTILTQPYEWLWGKIYLIYWFHWCWWQKGIQNAWLIEGLMLWNDWLQSYAELMQKIRLPILAWPVAIAPQGVVSILGYSCLPWQPYTCKLKVILRCFILKLF